ncbi:cystatin-B-like [Mixophyes fleayi]|uniref:cystatin-B-like n=1 Tax=Mixophyes fleayi TaxID=3061075 RepID=UPI003F4E347F
MAVVGGLPGGVSRALTANPEVQHICDQVKAEVEKKEKRKFKVFIAISFLTQVVCGTNYFVKVQVGDAEFYHLRIHQALPHEQGKLTLSGCQGGKTKKEAVVYF